MKRTQLYAAIAVVLLAAAFWFGWPKLKEEIAYIRGLQAYVYGFPLVLMDVTNGVLTATPKSGQYSAPINQFMRVRTFVNPDFDNVVRISRNSLWSVAVLDLDREPMVLSFPDTKGRYFVMQAMNMWTDDFASVGTRTGNTGGGSFLIAGPKWNGAAPPDVKETFRSSTRYAWVLVQMAASGPQDFPAIHALQDALAVTPLSAWGKSYTPPDNVPVDPAVDTTATPYDQVRLMDAGHFFKRLAMAMKDNPPYPADAPMIGKLKKLGIEPGQDFDISRLDPAVARGLNHVPQKVWDIFESAPQQTNAQKTNGWLLFLKLGKYGTDYNTRALVAWLGLGAATADDVIYPTAYMDGDGRPLWGDSAYVMHFEKGQIFPSHSGVWSISPYRENFYVRNSIDRYAISGTMPLTYNSDGSLDMYIQAESPGPDKESNWLPCPPSGPFNISIRVYQPDQAMLDGRTKNGVVVEFGTYKIPPIRKMR